MYDIIIIGGGPAGLTAATYARRAGKTVLVIEKHTFGGQITWSPLVENFPAIQSVSGTELGDRMLEQAMEHGADVELEEVVSVELDGDIKRVHTESGAEFAGRALIIATGAKPRMLGLAREAELVGSGVCYCAVCDGAFYKGSRVKSAAASTSSTGAANFAARRSSSRRCAKRRTWNFSPRPPSSRFSARVSLRASSWSAAARG